MVSEAFKGSMHPRQVKGRNVSGKRRVLIGESGGREFLGSFPFQARVGADCITIACNIEDLNCRTPLCKNA